MKKELTYEERISWFVDNYYEAGMEYSDLLESMKDEDLDNFEWYGEKIDIPKYLEKTLTKEQRRFDEGYVMGIFNTGGIDVLLEELKRLENLGIDPHEILNLTSKNN